MESTVPYTRTDSARQAFEEAVRSAHASSQLIDTIHVFSAILSLPGFHDSAFREFRIDRDS